MVSRTEDRDKFVERKTTLSRTSSCCSNGTFVTSPLPSRVESKTLTTCQNEAQSVSRSGDLQSSTITNAACVHGNNSQSDYQHQSYRTTNRRHVRFQEDHNVYYDPPANHPVTDGDQNTWELLWYSRDETKHLKEDVMQSVAVRSALYQTWRNEPAPSNWKQSKGRRRGRGVAGGPTNLAQDPFEHVYRQCCVGNTLTSQQVHALTRFLDEDSTGLECLVLKHSIPSIAKDKEVRRHLLLTTLNRNPIRVDRLSHNSRERRNSSKELQSLEISHQMADITEPDRLFALAMGQVLERQV